MKKYISLIILSMTVSILHAQFVVEKQDGSTVSWDGNLSFTQNKEDDSWSAGTTYNAQLDLSQIKRIYADESIGTGKLVFDANGGTGTMAPITGLKDGQEFTLPRNTFTRKNYRFIGWSYTKAKRRSVVSRRIPLI